MNIEEIENVARAYKCVLSDAYKNAMLSLRDSLEAAALSSDQQEEVTELYLYTSPEKLFRENASVRNSPNPWTQDISDWPENYFVIGDDQCGNHYYLDTTQSDSNAFVCFYDHEIPCFKSLNLLPEEYVAYVIDLVLEEY